MSTITIKPAKYKAGERPRVKINRKSRVAMPGDDRGDYVLTRINSRTAYVRSRYIVGELAFDADEVELVRDTEGKVVLETQQWPPLTPYDTGERYEPKVWPVNRREHKRYGKVDFDNDASETEVTVWVGRVDGEVTVHILGHGYIDHVVIDTQGEGDPTIMLDDSLVFGGEDDDE